MFPLRRVMISCLSSSSHRMELSSLSGVLFYFSPSSKSGIDVIAILHISFSSVFRCTGFTMALRLAFSMCTFTTSTNLFRHLIRLEHANESGSPFGSLPCPSRRPTLQLNPGEGREHLVENRLVTKRCNGHKRHFHESMSVIMASDHRECAPDSAEPVKVGGHVERLHANLSCVCSKRVGVMATVFSTSFKEKY